MYRKTIQNFYINSQKYLFNSVRIPAMINYLGICRQVASVIKIIRSILKVDKRAFNDEWRILFVIYTL